MSLSFCVLGSGSAGNSTLLICGGEMDSSTGAAPGRRHCMLIDAGLSPRMTSRRMAGLGVRLTDIQLIVLTHLDSDHFHAGWLKAIEQRGIRLYVHQRHRMAAWEAGVSMKWAELFTDRLACEDGPCLTSVLCAHDNLGSVSFVIEHAGLRLGYATDLGRVPSTMHERFTELHALAIESNYDRQMQQASGRPEFLKRRIMGGMGHLSNEQALEAIQGFERRCDLGHIALLHLSRQCNDPTLVRRLYAEKAPHLLQRLVITSQHEPSPLLEVRRMTGLRQTNTGRAAAQLPLFAEAMQPFAASA
jgi:phosphoribosyl 1,2-cyclic phosphodiesterase